LQAAEICFSDKAEIDKAIARYDEAAKCAREAGGERQAQILEQCYFRLAEHYYSQKNWSVALENYLLLRKLGTKINLLPRILRCQAELQLDSTLAVRGDADVEFIRQKIQENAGTFVAAEAEVFLLDRQLAEALDRKGATAGLPEQYAALLKKYPREVLAQQSLESYIYCQIGMCFAAEDTPAAQRNAMAAFERAAAVDPNTPYKRDALENLARAADAAGDTQKAFQVYERLFEMSAAEAEKKGEAQADAALGQRMAEYLRSMITRAEQKDSVEEALAVAQRVIDKKGVFSAAARHAMFYMGELYYLKKDFATAAKTYRQFLKAYGPPQDAKGEVVNGPWKPSSQNEQTEQVYEAAARIAHCWYMQGHAQNMVAAYEWIVRNFTYRNRWMAEAQYWLAQELIKGKKGLEAEARRRFAEAIWKTVVHPSLDFEDRDFRKNFHFWTADPTMQKYVKAAILKAGQAFSEVGDHDLAAGVFRQYLELYPERLEHRRGGSDQPDPLRSIARYALGREYVALANVTRLVESYRPYLDGLRDDKFRGSALMLLGYHAAAGGATEAAVEAYATLLDEYGENERDSQGRLIPVPAKDRVRKSKYGWDGIRLEPPPGLNLGEVRYSLGYLYWKKEEWANGVRILAPFAEDPRLLSNPARAKALYMAAQSYYRLYDYPNGLALVKKILRDHPRFEAIEEVYVAAARGCIETRQWSEVDPLVQRFVRDQPRSPHRPHMDLYAAVAMLGLGKTDEGLARLKSIAESETYEDVKADACYHLGLYWLNQKPPDYRTAAGHLDKSVAMYPREASCLAAAKCYVELKDWPKARDLLERTLRAFPGGNPQVLDEARRQLSEVQKQMVKQG
jgi:tetratricopeptide (TPR) repeat protein